jgi:Protein of unknown function (DUF1559)
MVPFFDSQVVPGSLMKHRGLLVVIAILAGVAFLLIPAMYAAREATSVMHCSNTAKQISLAIQNYTDTFGHLPPCAIVDSDGRPIHSWRAVVTPYMAALPQVYRWDEPWNGILNQRLLDGTPIHLEGPTSGKPAKGLPWHGPIDYAMVFRCSSEQTSVDFHVDYYAIVGTNCIWSAGRKCDLNSVGDGIANTILIAESTNVRALWSEPTDLDFDNMSFKVNDPTRASISSNHRVGPAVVFADGSVFRLDPKIPEQIVKGLLTANGGEKIDREEIHRSGWLH